MPRMHDNFRGGDWSEDMEAPLNNENTNIVYKKFAALSEPTANAYSYDMTYIGAAVTHLNFLAAEGAVFPNAISNKWVKLSNRGDRLLNRVMIKDINLSIAGNTMTAFVGHSGAGKSTILNLIPRFFDAKSGDILIDETKIT